MIALFGGTTEGRILAEYCDKNKIDCAYFAATKAGCDEVSHCKSIKPYEGRLNENEISMLFANEKFKEVYDATHPYAAEVSKNIKNACDKNCVPYIRVKRAEVAVDSEIIYTKDINDVIDCLNRTEETVLVTTGSKDAKRYTSVKNFENRIYLRILPDEKIIEQILQYGYKKNHILTGKGPFTEKENIKIIEYTSSKILVTKDSGQAGGFAEKISAAKKCGCKVLCIKRPNESGIGIEETKRRLSKWIKKHI